MLQDVDVIAWDFDGVLNRNLVNDQFEWIQQFKEDLNVSWPSFAKVIFSEHYEDVLIGKVDLKTPLQQWAEIVGYTGDLDDFMHYWFERDSHPDQDLIGLMETLSQTGVRQVIATNNEAHRLRYIGEDMGYMNRVETIFASGPMGCAKPNADYFAQITTSLGVPPARMLLIDDREENVSAAQDMGWKALHFTPKTKEQILKVLKEA